MSWICPKCNRSFKLEDQWHSCVKVSIEDHFKNRPSVRPIFDLIYQRFIDKDKIRIEAVKNSILFKAPSVFLTVKVKKDHLELEPILKEPFEEFPVYKTFRYSKNKVIHHIAVYDEEDLDEIVWRLLDESYELTK